jgi:outer membrane protein assembly factor BamB
MMTCFVLLLALGQDWPHWRGPDRNGVVSESSGWGSPGWPLQQPVWTRNVGEGNTSPLVIRDRLYTMGWAKEQDTVACLDAATGKELWKVSYPCPPRGRHHLGDEKYYAGPIATPEWDPAGGFLYTLSNDGDLHCWDPRGEGRKVWSRNLTVDFGVEMRPHVGAERRDYGYITSPFVSGGDVVVQVGSPEGTVMAFAKDTGTRRWVSECKDPAGHGGGMTPISVEGVPCLALLTLRNLLVLRLDAGREGKTVATHPWTTDFGNNIATPAVHQDGVLITSEYNHKSICRLKVTLRGATPVWEKPYASKACSPVIHDGSVYFAWQRLRCLDWASGEQRWEGGSFGDAGSCVVTGDGKLIVWGGLGRLSLVETAGASPDRYKELAVTARIFSAAVWPHVVLSDGRLYCKDRDGNLKCFRVRDAK